MSVSKKTKKLKLTRQEKKEAKLKKKEEKKALIAAMTSAQRKKHRLKTAALAIILILAVLIILYFAGMLILKLLTKDKPIVEPDTNYTSYNFYEVPEEKEAWSEIDISEIARYLNPDGGQKKEYASEDALKNDLYAKFPSLKSYPESYPSDLAVYSTLSYKPMYSSANFGGTFLFEDIPSDMKHEGLRFFEKYFNMLYKGDYKSYPSMFSDKYDFEIGFERNINREFPPQMIYNITVDEKARVGNVTVDDKSCIIGLYEVSFLIHNNNGLFRNDIGKNMDLGTDVARPLYFELITYNAGTGSEKTYIQHIYSEEALKARQEQK